MTAAVQNMKKMAIHLDRLKSRRNPPTFPILQPPKHEKKPKILK